MAKTTSGMGKITAAVAGLELCVVAYKYMYTNSTGDMGVKMAAHKGFHVQYRI